MAIRTTAGAVKKIIETDLELDSELDPFIETSSALIDEVCALALKPDGSLFYDAVRLELIERWLAAHFYTMFAARTESDKAGPVSEKIQSKIDLGLQLSHHGQQVLILDTNGGLAALNRNATTGGPTRAGIFWLGTTVT